MIESRSITQSLMESHTLFNKQSNVAMNKVNNPSLKYYLGHFIIVDDSIQPIQPALLQHALIFNL